MNAVAYFEIQVDNLKRAKDFYGQIFDWKFVEQPGLPIEYWRIENAGPNGGLLQRPVPIPNSPAGTNAFCCSIQVENFNEIAKNILDHNGIVALEKFAVPGVCWQGYFLDTEGNTFGIFQPDPEAK